jgi:signal transduction histidine kinase
VQINIRDDGQAVLIDITDDGYGGADANVTGGLRGLRDRVATVDGTLHIDSPAGEGTRIVATIPLETP